jgi:hypothetical protein
VGGQSLRNGLPEDDPCHPHGPRNTDVGIVPKVYGVRWLHRQSNGSDQGPHLRAVREVHQEYSIDAEVVTGITADGIARVFQEAEFLIALKIGTGTDAYS